MLPSHIEMMADLIGTIKQPELKRFMTHFPNHEHHPLHASHFWQDDQGEAAADHIMDWAKRRGWIG